eukprot:TRINITY_DN66969_c6_g1_i1.p1 TRINITY_DN66969_c6_g1~~TRINITY_DN66969_c6_g1_i1.p1  ORF type:complete len:307 (+),score=26.73 TRINITY_DN66969_c6_g1_i1:73-921(+)
MANVSIDEIRWLLERRSIPATVEEATRQLAIDYPDFPTIEAEFTAKNLIRFLPTLVQPGVGTRWKQFLAWLQAEPELPTTAEHAFFKFAQSLGRVTSYRCLSLTPEQYKTIQDTNQIWPSGRLQVDDTVLNQLVDSEGVWKIAHARLYIGQRMVPYDPSLSLHDDPETAVTIATTYLAAGKKAYLMGMDVPKIECLGFLLRDVSTNRNDEANRWFSHKGVMFDGWLERTERYVLYTIPFFKERCRTLKVLATDQELQNFIHAFSVEQKKKYETWKAEFSKQQ